MAMALRTEKSTKNQDDVRVLLVGAIIAILMMTLFPLVQQKWDVYFMDRPFVSAETLKLVRVEGQAEPSILYDADAKLAVDSTWIATIEDKDDGHGPIFLRHGLGAYSVKVDGPKVWTWESWFDNGLDGVTPDVPDIPFKICVRYVSVTKRSHVEDESPKYCSPLVNPVTLEEIKQ